jgi:circadian clock protein KaiC
LGGYYRGSSVLLSGTAGTGKTTVAASLVRETCARGERCLYFSFEESPAQIVRNMRSVGIDLRPALNKGLLRIVSNRAFFYGLEMHLVSMHREVYQFKPSVVVVDPITAFTAAASEVEVRAMITRLIDFLKSEKITALLTNLTSGGTDLEATSLMISSLIDTWLLLRDIELNGERNRGLYVLKSRGMPHSNQIREFVLTTEGVKLIDAYLGNGGVLTGSSRIAQETREHEERIAREEDLARRVAALERKRHTLEAQILAMRADFAAEESEIQRMLSEQRGREKRHADERLLIAASRKTNGTQVTGERQ